MATDVKQCPACGSADIRGHCDSTTCDWWRCVRCTAYGSATRMWEPKQEKGNR